MQDFIRCVDFTRITTLYTADDVATNYVTQRIFNTVLSCSCVHFVVEND